MASPRIFAKLVNVTKQAIRDRCTDAVFERGQDYCEEGRIQRINRFGDIITAAVQGSTLYELTIEVGPSTINPRCSCPYDGPGDCKHIVAVLLDIVDAPPSDERDRVQAVLDDVADEDLRAFVIDTFAIRPELRDQFLARFDDTDMASKSVEEYRAEIEGLFNQHTEEYPVVVDAIDFSRFFDIAEQYQERDHYRSAATVYRALFEAIDDNIHLVDAAYDHYAQVLRSAIDGYVDCVHVAELDADAFESYARVLDERASTGADIHREQFMDALEELEEFEEFGE